MMGSEEKGRSQGPISVPTWKMSLTERMTPQQHRMLWLDRSKRSEEQEDVHHFFTNLRIVACNQVGFPFSYLTFIFVLISCFQPFRHYVAISLARHILVGSKLFTTSVPVRSFAVATHHRLSVNSFSRSGPPRRPEFTSQTMSSWAYCDKELKAELHIPSSSNLSVRVIYIFCVF